MLNRLEKPFHPAIEALYTDRKQGVSQAPFNRFNLATHVGDASDAVQKNRDLLRQEGGLPGEPVWLDQQHTDIHIQLTQAKAVSPPPLADASWTTQPGLVCAVLTADCLPILFASQQGDCVGAIHAGWRGLAQGIISQTIQALPVSGHDLDVWIGPAISADFFEVGEEVRAAFTDKDTANKVYFQRHPHQRHKYFADLAGLAQAELEQLGVASVVPSKLCSFADKSHFYSYRRDGQTGRMASLIWIKND